MLQNATVEMHGPKGGFEASIVISSDSSDPSRGSPMPVASPAGARRMRYNRKGTRVESGVPLLVPGVYPFQAVVDSVCLDVEGCDHGLAVGSFLVAGGALAEGSVVDPGAVVLFAPA